MSAPLTQPSFRQTLSVLWFPFFLAVFMSIFFILPLGNPEPRAVHIGVTAASAPAAEHAAAELRTTLATTHPEGFDITPIARGDAQDLIRAGDLAAVVSTGPETEILLASGAGPARATYLGELLTELIDAPITDLIPAAAGDPSGSGLFFFVLPIAIVGMVSAIMARQLVAWSYFRRCLTILGIGVFTAVVTYLIALWQQVFPASPSSLWVMAGSFALTVGIGWVVTGVAEYVKQFLLPFALTFVLVLGVPTAGASVTPDMLPGFFAALHQVMPMGQFVALIRSVTYGVGSAWYPAAVLIAWLLIGLLVCVAADRHHRRTKLIDSVRP